MNDELRTGGEIVDDADRRTSSHRLRARSVIVGIVVLLAGGLIVEQVGAAPGTTRRARTNWSSFEPRLAPKPAASDSSTPTGSAALAAANKRTDAAIARTESATASAGSGTAAVTPTPRLIALGPRVCPILLEEGAELIDQTNRLIAANPSLAPQLIQTRDRGLARINVQLARFGCAISFG